jgi:hypothetical protein
MLKMKRVNYLLKNPVKNEEGKLSVKIVKKYVKLQKTQNYIKR